MTTENFTTPGTFEWTCPAGVTSVDAKVWGAGGGGNISSVPKYHNHGGGGGAFSGKTGIVVVPGNKYAVKVGAGAWNSAGEDSHFIDATTVMAKGGAIGGEGAGTGGAAASGFGDTRWSGGLSPASTSSHRGSGGGGAAGDSEDGGDGGGGAAAGVVGIGGDTGGGNGGVGSDHAVAAGPGVAPGGGGGGPNYGGPTNGATGAAGKVVLDYEVAEGWTNIAKVSGVASADFAKVNGVEVAAIAKMCGVAV